jgi:hypothetical protein
MRQNLVLMVLTIIRMVILTYFLKGLLFNKSIANSSSCLVLYLLRKKGGLLNSLLISANFSCLFLSYNFQVLTPTHKTTQAKQIMKSMPKTMETTLAIMLNSPQKTMAMAT